MEAVLSLIIQKLKTAAEAGDYHLLQFKRKAINALFPYAVWQEGKGQPEVLDAFLCAARASHWTWFTWYRTREFISTLLSKASPRAIVLTSPYILLHTNERDFLPQLAEAISTVPYNDEVAQCVVDALLLIASDDDLLPCITVDMWSWLKTKPSLSPLCWGRYFGTSQQCVKAVRGLKDIEILKSYFLTVWSEWNTLWNSGFDEVCASAHEDFGGTGMGHHRADLIQQLDHILGELDQGLEYLRLCNPNLDAYDLQRMKYQYGALKDIILRVNAEVITRMSSQRYRFSYHLLVWMCTGSHATFMCTLPLL